MKRRAWLFPASGLFALALLASPARLAGAADERAPATAPPLWVRTWASAQQLAEAGQAPPAPGLTDATLRQLVHVSLGGRRIRVEFSNVFGTTPLELLSVHVALSAGGGAIRAESDAALTFGGRPAVTIPRGAPMVSDPLAFDLPAFSNLAVTVRLRGAPAELTLHPGSRTTSYVQAGDAVSAPELPGAARVDHWYFLSGVDVLADAGAAAVAILGDSITDGRGSTTNGNDRWTDALARRLGALPATAQVAVLNQGIGGNRLLRDGLGPNALARLDRDVLAQPGVRWLVVLEGINDIGTRVAARQRGESAASAEDIIAAYEQIILRAHARAIRVYGATMLPFEGAADYFTPDGETDRQKINAWIRTSARFDGVIDFDAATRDLARPARMSAAVDGGDHLHPSADGYRIMADVVDLALFASAR